MSERHPANTLHQITPHVWWFTPESRTDRPSLGLVVGSKGTLMLDIGASLRHTHDFLETIAQAGLPSPDFVALTHWHWDHTFGMGAIDVPVVAHRITADNLARIAKYDYSDAGLDKLVQEGLEVDFIREYMRVELTDAQRQALTLRQPDTIMDTRYRFNLGDVTCEMVHVGGDHAKDACVMHIVEDAVLFLGDCFYDDVYAQPRRYTCQVLDLITRLEAFDAHTFIEGHSDAIVDKATMMRWSAIIKHIFAAIDAHGSKRDAILQTVVEAHGEEDVVDFLDSILAGLVP
jgi:glyoxylase-like metal-dependent hydrolase (beta-lactamase superfamily II)